MFVVIGNQVWLSVRFWKIFQIQNRITWQREKGRGANHNWKNGMEDIWFATMNDDYTFNLDDVKIRRRVLAPYKENGKPKDWEQTENGRFRNTCPSNFGMTFLFPTGQCPKIPLIRHKNRKNLSLN